MTVVNLKIETEAYDANQEAYRTYKHGTFDMPLSQFKAIFPYEEPKGDGKIVKYYDLECGSFRDTYHYEVREESC